MKTYAVPNEIQVDIDAEIETGIKTTFLRHLIKHSKGKGALRFFIQQSKKYPYFWRGIHYPYKNPIYLYLDFMYDYRRNRAHDRAYYAYRKNAGLIFSMKVRFKIASAVLLGRLLWHCTGSSKTSPRFVQYSSHRLERWQWWRWYVEICTLCHKPMPFAPKDGWAGSYGVKEDFILCPKCYDTYDLKRK